jgi:hypothetical protein
LDQIFRINGVVNRDPGIDIWLKGQPGELGSMAPFGYVNVFKSHVNVGFFMGAHLKDPTRLLEGTGKNGRHVKLKQGVAVDSAALRKLIDAAYWDIKARLGVG